MQEIGGVIPDAILAELVAALGIEMSSNTTDEDIQMTDAEVGELKLKSTKKVQTGGFAKVRDEVEKIVREGYSASQILTQVSSATYRCMIAEFGIPAPRLAYTRSFAAFTS